MRRFSIRRNEKISAHVTVRGEKAMQLIESGLKVKEFELEHRNFSESGAAARGRLCATAAASGPLLPNALARKHAFGMPLSDAR